MVLRAIYKISTMVFVILTRRMKEILMGKQVKTWNDRKETHGPDLEVQVEIEGTMRSQKGRKGNERGVVVMSV